MTKLKFYERLKGALRKNTQINMKKTFEIKKWIDGSVIYSGEAETLELLVKMACEAGVALNGANLSNLNFSGMTFPPNSSFDNSRFDNSRFYNSSFDNSSFDNSRFYNSRFDNSSFDNSRFDEKSLLQVREALTPIKADFFLILLRAIPEIPFLRQALVDGKIDGSTYTGTCACLCGTIAIARHCSYEALEGIKPNGNRPAERWFAAIHPGNTPENNQTAQITLEWIDEFTDSLFLGKALV